MEGRGIPTPERAPVAKENFQTSVENAKLWLKDVMDELGTESEPQALAALRAVLHVLRDKLVIDESAHLSAQLPTIIRGIYFEGWNPGREKIRGREIFLTLVNEELTSHPEIDPEDAVRSVFTVLANRITKGEITDVRGSLEQEIRELMPEGVKEAPRRRSQGERKAA